MENHKVGELISYNQWRSSARLLGNLPTFAASGWDVSLQPQLQRQDQSLSTQQLAGAGSSGTATDFAPKDAAGLAYQAGDALGQVPCLHGSTHIWGSHDFRVSSRNSTCHLLPYTLHSY